MPSADAGIFCCKAAAPAPLPANHKPHHDPNRDLHQKLHTKFILYAIRRHEEVDRLERVRNEEEERKERYRIQEDDRLENYRLQANQAIYQKLRSMIDSRPSTPLSFSCTTDSMSPAQYYNPPLPKFSQLPQLPQLPEYGLIAALKMTPKQPDPEPVLTFEQLANNPLKAETPYVIHLTAREDFGPVYDHRYFIWSGDMEQDWIEVTKPQWFAHSSNFVKMKAEKWDMKCAKHKRFFRLILMPNLALRGRFSAPAPANTALARRLPAPHRFSPRATYTSRLTYPMTNGDLEAEKQEGLTHTSVPAAESKQLSYAQAYHQMANKRTETVKREGSSQAFMPPEVEQSSCAQTYYPMATGGAETVHRDSLTHKWMPSAELRQLLDAQAFRQMGSSETETVQRENSMETLISSPEVNQFSYAQPYYPMVTSGPETVQSDHTVSRSQVPYAPAYYPMATGGTQIVQSDYTVPRNQLSYAQIAQIAYPMGTGGMGYVEGEYLAPILMPTTDMKQVSYVVADGVVESGLGSSVN